MLVPDNKPTATATPARPLLLVFMQKMLNQTNTGLRHVKRAKVPNEEDFLDGTGDLYVPAPEVICLGCGLIRAVVQLRNSVVANGRRFGLPPDSGNSFHRAGRARIGPARS